LTTLVWKNRREVYMLTNVDPPPAEGNFCDDSNRPVKPHIMERYNRHMDYVDNSDCMANSCSFDESMYLQVDHKIVFPSSGSKK
jgi:hypothetical protein